MTFFEGLLVLLLAATIFVADLTSATGAVSGHACGGRGPRCLSPGTPYFALEPNAALALFIAPVIVDAAFGFPPVAALRFLGPLLAFAGFAVLLTTAIVAVISRRLLGIPVAVAIAFGAIIAPPDAAAAAAWASPPSRRNGKNLKLYAAEIRSASIPADFCRRSLIGANSHFCVMTSDASSRTEQQQLRPASEQVQLCRHLLGIACRTPIHNYVDVVCSVDAPLVTGPRAQRVN